MPPFAGEPAHWIHNTEIVDEPSTRLHYVESPPANPNGHTLILIHGFPETWYAFRHVIQPFSDLGYRTISVDYRGAGDSSRPRDGYTKMEMAKDIHTLLVEKLGVKKYIVVGYDIGSMIAVSLAMRYRDDLEALVTFEAPIPGTQAFDKMTSDPSSTFSGLYHFFFHMQPDLPELLTQGKEREYITHFYNRICFDPSFLTPSDIDIYARSFSTAGGMRCGFDVYRAFLIDKEDFRQNLKEKGKISIPVLACDGDHSMFTKYIVDMTKEFAQDVTHDQVPRSNHWLPEENPEYFVSMIHKFLNNKGLVKS